MFKIPKNRSDHFFWKIGGDGGRGLESEMRDG